jgi:hypothetical protein
VSVDDATKKGRDPVEIEAIQLAPDRRSVVLKIPSLRPVMQMKIQMMLESADGMPVEYSIYNTINKVPGESAASPAPAGSAGGSVAAP